MQSDMEWTWSAESGDWGIALNGAEVSGKTNKAVDISAPIDNMSIYQPNHFRSYKDGFVPVKWDGVSYAGSFEAGVGKALGNTAIDLVGFGWEPQANSIGSLVTGDPNYKVLPRFEVKMDEQELAGYYGTIGLSFLVGGEISLLSKGSKVSNVTKGRVFWSGGNDAMNAAMNYAKANNMTTLEMTRAGQNLTKLTNGMPWEEAAPMWQRLSAAYAKGAKGPVHVFQNANTGIRINSVWRTVEYPILNGKNNIIYHNVFKP